jgi:hypothetical protein
MRIYQSRARRRYKCKSAPAKFGALEAHSQPRRLGIRSMHGGMNRYVGRELVFFETRVVQATGRPQLR